MYKDKPYAYPRGNRKVPWFRRRRTIALALVTLAGASWWFGILSPLSYLSKGDAGATKSSKTTSSWFGKPAVGWDERAERVKDAFKLSFSGYEKYAWGTYQVWLPR